MPRGRPTNSRGRTLVGIYFDDENLFKMVQALTPPGQTKIPYGAQSDLINHLLAQWLAEREKRGTA